MVILTLISSVNERAEVKPGTHASGVPCLKSAPELCVPDLLGPQCLQRVSPFHAVKLIRHLTPDAVGEILSSYEAGQAVPGECADRQPQQHQREVTSVTGRLLSSSRTA